MSQINAKKQWNQNVVYTVAYMLILCIGISLRSYQYLMGRSLWEDECHLALNFIDYGYLRLLKPLDYIQGAPILWIYSVKTFGKIFGYGECSLRATTFIASILTFPLFYSIALQLTKRRITALIGFLIFACNGWLIYYSSELKSYSVDLSVYLLMVYLALSDNPWVVKRRNTLLSVAGCLSILFSSTGFIVLFCIAFYMMRQWYCRRKINTPDIFIFIPWAIVFAINYFSFIYHHPSFVQQRINFASSFMPLNIFSPEFVRFIDVTTDEVFFSYLLFISKSYGFAYILLLIFAVCIYYLIARKKTDLLIFTCLPVLVHLGLSAVKIYPFIFRLVLYLAPALIILISTGTVLIASFLARKIHTAVGGLFAVICCICFVQKSIASFPLWGREIKPAIDFINKNLPGRHIYVTDPVHAYRYYYLRHYAKDSIYEEVPWTISPNDFYGMVSGETKNYILFYNSGYHWGYDSVLEDLKRRNLIVSHFEYRAYAVSEVRPLKDTFINSIYSYFNGNVVVGEGLEKTAAVWNSFITSKPIYLTKGDYEISIISNGTPVGNVYSKNLLSINNDSVGIFTSGANYQNAIFNFKQLKDTTVTMVIRLLNDSATKTEDRNTFIKGITIVRSDTGQL